MRGVEVVHHPPRLSDSRNTKGGIRSTLLSLTEGGPGSADLVQGGVRSSLRPEEGREGSYLRPVELEEGSVSSLRPVEEDVRSSLGEGKARSSLSLAEGGLRGSHIPGESYKEWKARNRKVKEGK